MSRNKRERERETENRIFIPRALRESLQVPHFASGRATASKKSTEQKGPIRRSVVPSGPLQPLSSRLHSSPILHALSVVCLRDDGRAVLDLVGKDNRNRSLRPNKEVLLYYWETTVGRTALLFMSCGILSLSLGSRVCHCYYSIVSLACPMAWQMSCRITTR